MKEQILDLLNTKKLVVSNYLIKVAFIKKLSLNEFLVLVYFDNSASRVFDIDLLCKTLYMKSNDAMEAFNSLMVKNLISLKSVKDLEGRFNEVVSMDEVYSIIFEELEEKKNESTKVDIFKTFESELGRTMSSMELELINGWLLSGTTEEIILGALREAIYNGVRNFRYIDKIIFEWEKKGFKTMNDVNQYMSNRRSEKSKKEKVSKQEQEILDYDWLDS